MTATMQSRVYQANQSAAPQKVRLNPGVLFESAAILSTID